MQQIRALAVDDSSIYRKVVGQALAGMQGVLLVGSAAHGKEALGMLQREKVDLITLDLEMPEMDGVATLKALKQIRYAGKVIVLSAMSRAGADATMRAMAAGADDFLLKPQAGEAGTQALSAADLVRSHLLPKVQQFWGWLGEPKAVPAVLPVLKLAPQLAVSGPFWPQAIVVASSTGGPAALEAFFSKLSPLPALPILVAQHMPAMFTASLATHLSQVLKAPVKEAQDGQALSGSGIYVAPGDFHLRLKRRSDSSVVLRLDQDERRNFVRPSADHLFESAAEVYGRHCLGIVLTGMGSDGRDGAVALKKAGGRVFIQNKASCAVFGMPKAVQDAGAADSEADLPGLADLVQRLLARKSNQCPNS